MLVRELMTEEPLTVPLGTTVKSALGVLAAAGITSVPVVGRHGRLRGVVSEADLIRDGLDADSRLHEIALDPVRADRPRFVDEVMTTHVITVRPDNDLLDAVELLTSTGAKSLPVIDRNSHVVGMISRSDVVRLLARSDHDLECEVDAALASVGLRDWMVEVCDGTVELVAPAGHEKDCRLARIMAATVPGVEAVYVSSNAPRPTPPHSTLHSS
jgi:CBS domain-containing protein